MNFDLFSSADPVIEEEAQQELDTSTIGRHVEFLVCAELTRAGYWVEHINAPGFDVLLSSRGRVYRIEVKSSSVVRDGYGVWHCRRQKPNSVGQGRIGAWAYKRPLTREDADVVALHHLVAGATCYLPVVGGCGRVVISMSQLRALDASSSIESALAQL
jgi:hypothetical protein